MKSKSALWAGLGAAAVVAGGAVAWRGAESVAWRRRLPRIPDLSRYPASLRADVEQAERSALHPGTSTPGLIALGQLYHANDFGAQAETCWRMLAAREPAEGRWTYYVADLRRNAGDEDGMGTWLRETVRRSPGYGPAWLKLGDWEFKRGDDAAAERAYSRRLELLPGDPYAELGLARITLQKGDEVGARRRLEAIVQTHPDFYPAHNVLAELLARAGDPSGAASQRALGRAARRFRDAEDPWLEELRAYCFNPPQLIRWASIQAENAQGDLGEALLKRAIQVSPDDPAPRDDLGRVYLQRHAWEKAREAFETAIALPQAPSDAFAGLSELYRDENRPDLAVAAARRGLAALPDSADLEAALGNSLLEAGQPAAAAEAFRAAAERAPQVAQTHYDLAIALIRLGRKNEARRALDRALAVSPRFPAALRSRAELELAEGNWQAAEAYVRPLYADNPSLKPARALMAAWCLEAGSQAARAGQFETAAERLREGVTADPDLPELHARLGLLLGQQGRPADALKELLEYRRLAPREPLAALFVGQAYLHLGNPDAARKALQDARDLAAGDPRITAACDTLLGQLP